MGDELENPNADDATAAPPDAPEGPVQAARDDAWLAQFRADNAAAVAQHNFEAANLDMAEGTAARAERDYDLKRADYATSEAAKARHDASEDEKKAGLDAARHDEWEFRRQEDLHLADTADHAAATFRDAAAAADKRSTELFQEARDIGAIYGQNKAEYDLIQEQAVAAQRIATDEAKLPHPGDPAPADPADHSQP